MAENTVFFLEDEDEELGGFNDPILPVEEKEEPKKTEDDITDGDIEKEPEKEPDPEEAKEPEKEPESNPFEEQFNKAMGLVTSQTEQINTLVEQNKVLQSKFDGGEQEQPPEKPVFTQEQWDDDSQACNEAMHNYYKEEQQFHNNISTQEQEKETETNQANFQASTQESWDLSTVVLPELADNEKARQAWSAIYYDQKTGYSQDPNGALKATKTLKTYMEKNNLSFDATPVEKSEDDKKKGAADEAARQARVKKGTMHTGGQSDGSKTVNLTAEQKGVCRQMNISEEAYAATLSAMGRAS